MSAGEKAQSETIDWFVEPDQHGKPAHASRRARLDEDRANSVGIAIITSLFFVLFAAALLVGGRVAFGPLLHRAIAREDAKAMGDVVYSMPDGVFCRHMSFNNTTAEVSEGALVPCPNPIGGRSLSASKFEWGTH